MRCLRRAAASLRHFSTFVATLLHLSAPPKHTHAQDPEEWGVHMECLRCLMLLITGFGRLAAPDIGPALTAAWQVRQGERARACLHRLPAARPGPGPAWAERPSSPGKGKRRQAPGRRHASVGATQSVGAVQRVAGAPGSFASQTGPTQAAMRPPPADVHQRAAPVLRAGDLQRRGRGRRGRGWVRAALAAADGWGAKGRMQRSLVSPKYCACRGWRQTTWRRWR